MTRPSRIHVRDRRKRRLATLVVISLFTVAVVTWLSINHKRIIPYLIIPASKTEKDQSLTRDYRGTIYDRGYRELAESLERVSVYALPREVGTISETAARLAPVLGRSKNELMLMLNNEQLRILLVRDIDQETEEKIRKLRLPGIFLGKEVARYYPQRDSFAHLLGYMDKGAGLAGIEWHYNHLLGNYGAQLGKKAVQQNGRPSSGKGKGGFHLVLTFDLKIQRQLEKYIRNLTDDRKEARVAACVMDMMSGAIIGSAHYPSFEPGRFSDYDKSVLENILLQPIAVPDNFRRLFNDVSLEKRQYEKSGNILPWSVVSERIDLGSQIRFWEDLSLSSSLQLDFAKDDADHMEKKPFLPVGTSVDFGTVPEVATPFQLMTSISQLLNSGKKVVPYVLDRVIERKSKKEYRFHALNDSESGRVIDENFSNEVRRLLDVQSSKGKLSSFYLLGRKNSYKNGKSSAQYFSHKILFSYFPEDKSDLIFMVVVREPLYNLSKTDGMKWDSLMKGLDNIASSVIALQEVVTFNRDMMELSEREEVNFQLVHLEESEEKQKQVTTRIRINTGELNMPDLIGLSLRKSLRLLEKRNVTVKINGFGRVVEQKPEPGSSLEDNEECVLFLQSDYIFSLSDKVVQAQ